jgi:ABC-2 type transport system permease protein
MNQFKMDFKRNLKSLLIWSCVTAAVSALITALYPSMMQSDMLALMNAKLASLPAEFVAMLHMEGQDIRELPQYFAYMFQFVAMVSCIYGATLGFTALSREESEGTIEFLYAQPRRRSQIVTGKLASACVSYLVFFAAVSIASVLACIGVKPGELSLIDLVSPVKTVLLGMMIAGYTYLFLGLMISVFLKKAKHAASMAVGIFFLLYILGSIPAMAGVLDFLKWISPINYFIPNEVVVEGVKALHAVICIAAMAVFAGITYAVYRRKDFAV